MNATADPLDLDTVDRAALVVELLVAARRPYHLSVEDLGRLLSRAAHAVAADIPAESLRDATPSR